MKDNELKETIKGLIRGSGRSYPLVGEAEKQLSGETVLQKQQIVRNGVSQKESVGVIG